MPTSTLSARPDATCAAAVDLAAAAARDEAADDEAGDTVGAHLGVQAEGDRVATHFFAATVPGYVGWRWAVTVARASRSRLVTVDEIVLLPGEDALLPPEWVPWSDRLRPGDLGVGDLLPTPSDDDRLAPAYLLSDDPAVESVAFELGLGRPRVLSRLGREEAADRWYGGDGGPDTPMASHAPGTCGTCGFYLPISGSLRVLFGACGNEFSPRDGTVVSADSGCGAHSEALVEQPPPAAPPGPSYDDIVLEVEQHAGVPEVEQPDGEEAESLGHS